MMSSDVVEHGHDTPDPSGTPDPKCKPAPVDDDEPAGPILVQRRAEKLAQIAAEQGIAAATDEMYSEEPEKKKKRAEIVKTYKADIASDGRVRQKFDAAIGPFKAALEDLICKDGNSTRLNDWL